MKHKTSNESLGGVTSSFTLAKEATVLGLNAAPNSALAMIVVMNGMKFGCAIAAAPNNSQHSEIDETDTAPINGRRKLGGQ